MEYNGIQWNTMEYNGILALTSIDSICNMLVISALKSFDGKTQLTCGIAGVIRRLQLAFETCKSGPDYIDTTCIGQISLEPCTNLANRIDHRNTTWLAWAIEACVIEDNMGLMDQIIQAYAVNMCGLLACPKNKLILVLNCQASLQTSICSTCILWQLVSGIAFNNITSFKHEYALLQELKATGWTIVLAMLHLGANLTIRGRHLGIVQLSEAKPRIAPYLGQLLQWVYCNCNSKWMRLIMLEY